MRWFKKKEKKEVKNVKNGIYLTDLDLNDLTKERLGLKINLYDKIRVVFSNSEKLYLIALSEIEYDYSDYVHLIEISSYIKGTNYFYLECFNELNEYGDSKLLEYLRNNDYIDINLYNSFIKNFSDIINYNYSDEKKEYDELQNNKSILEKEQKEKLKEQKEKFINSFFAVPQSG